MELQSQDNDIETDTSSAWDHEKNPLNDPDERQVLFAALDSYRQYRKQAHFATTHKRRQNIYALPQDQWKLLALPPFNLLDTLSQIDDAIDTNADLADAILSIGLQSMGIEATQPFNGPQFWHNKAKPNDHAKAHSTIRQLYRDWSAQGFQREVKPVLDLILSDLQHNYLPPSTRATLLLPGAGLGRLLFELTLAGYHTTGNEISYHQLLASNFILNHTPAADAYTIHPFLSTFTNNLTRESQRSSFPIPDIHPSTTLAIAVAGDQSIGSMSMTAGDFILSYSTPDQTSTFDAVTTVYFIDTAPNLIPYITTVHNALKPGGLWINIGPLLWHFDNRQSEHDENANSTSTPIPESSSTSSNIHSNSTHPQHKPSSGESREDTGIANPGSFELTTEEVLQLVENFGFEILKSEVLDMQKYGSYIQDPESMLQNLYRPVHWVARKEG